MTQSAGAAAGGQSRRTYTVQPGDNLSKIAKHFYGDANQYMKIYQANRDQLSDPDKIRAGQELVIPESPGIWPRKLTAAAAGVGI